MKIFLPIKIKATGGTSIFAQKFKEGMEELGHEVTFERPEDYDIMLITAACERKYLWDAYRRRKKIVQRLDGVFYPSTIAGWLYRFYNATMKFINKRLVDGIIYQSEYSKYCCERFLGKPKAQNRAIIYNGIDINHFSPKGPKESLGATHEDVFITASRFRRLDQIGPLIQALDIYNDKYKKPFKFYVVGNFMGEIKKVEQKYKRPWLKFTGKIPNKELPRYYRGADIFLFSHQNPPCPNNVLEAMACGLPICGVGDGAMPEITLKGENSELLEVSGDAFFHTRKLDLEGFAAQINKILKEREKYAQKSRGWAIERFKLEDMVKSYEKFLKKILSKDPSSP